MLVPKNRIQPGQQSRNLHQRLPAGWVDQAIRQDFLAQRGEANLMAVGMETQRARCASLRLMISTFDLCV